MANDSLGLEPVVLHNTSPTVFPGPETLTGQHVTLELLDQKHIPEIYENVASHEDMWTWLPDGPFNTAADFADYLTPLIEKSDTLRVYAVLLRSGPSKDRAVGIASFDGADLENRVIECGLLFGSQLQRTRAGTEVMYLLGCLVFQKLDYRRLEWKCDSLNARSNKAAERYGFVYEATFRQHRIVKGKNRDSRWYSILDCEWPRCKQVFETWLEDGNFDEQGRQRRRMEETRDRLRSVKA